MPASFFTCSPRRHHLRVGDELHRVAVRLRIRGDLVRQRRPARRHIGIDECGEAVALTVLAPAQRMFEYRIVAIEDPFGEVHGIVVADREFLLIHRASGEVRGHPCVVLHAARLTGAAARFIVI